MRESSFQRWGYGVLAVLAAGVFLIGCGSSSGPAPAPPDTLAPRVTLASSASGATATAPFTITYAFSEAIDPSSFDASKVTVGAVRSDGMVPACQVGGMIRDASNRFHQTLSLPSVGHGSITISMASHAFKDMNGNWNTEGAQLVQAYDTGTPLPSAGLPLTFEPSETQGYSFTATGGATASLTLDPGGSTNHVLTLVKPASAQAQAGVTVALGQGFDAPATVVQFRVRVLAPEAGLALRLRLEDSADPASVVEGELASSLAGQWETLNFRLHGLDFSTTYDRVTFVGGAGEHGQDRTFAIDDLEVAGGFPGTLGLYKDGSGTSRIFGTLSFAAESSNGSATLDPAWTAETKEGPQAIALNCGDGTWGGGRITFGHAADLSEAHHLRLSLHTASMTPAVSSLELRFEQSDGARNGIDLCAFYPTVSGDWTTYTIPLLPLKTALYGSGASLLDLKTVTGVGLWNPSANGSPCRGTLYLDDIHFPGQAPPPAFSEALGEVVSPRFGTLGSTADSSNGTASMVLQSTAIAAIEGTFVTAMDPGTGTWGGGAITFERPELLSNLVAVRFSVNTKGETPAFGSLLLRLTQADQSMNSVDIADYPPTIDGDWATYVIPLAPFALRAYDAQSARLDLESVVSLGFWNPMAGGGLCRGPIYIDAIRFSYL